MPTVSVCLPVWNGAAYIAEAIDSILRQTYSHFELIIQDDHSSDDTPAILARYSDPRIHVLRQAEHMGQWRTLNLAIARATGRYLRFFSHDDRMLPTDLETMVRLLERHPEIGLCFGRYESIDVGGRRQWVNERISEQHGDTPLIAAPEQSAQLFFKYGCLPGTLSTVMVARAALTTCGVFDDTFRRSADWDLWVRISRRFPIGILAEVLTQVRTHPMQHSKYADQLASVRESFAIRTRLDRVLPPDYLAPRAGYLRRTLWLGHFRFAVRALATGRIRLGCQVLAEIARHEQLLTLAGLYAAHLARRLGTGR